MAKIKPILTPEEERQQNLEQLAKYRPLDDDFMRELFRNNLELAQYVLRIIIGKPDLKLTKEETQYDLQHLLGNALFALMYLVLMMKISNMTLKCRGRIRGHLLKGQDTIQVRWTLIISGRNSSLKSCPTLM